MWKLLSDENFNGDILRGLLLRKPDLNIERIQDVGLEEAEDPFILEWAAKHNRILFSHDRATMPDFAYHRVLAGQPMPGVIIVNDRLSVRQAIEDIFLLITCSEQNEWDNLVLYIPL